MIDLSTPVSINAGQNALENEKMTSLGHLGTHFDVMDLVFPLEYTRRQGIVFNVQNKDEISVSDIDTSLIYKGMFITFYSGFIEVEPYGSKRYFSSHPYLSLDLIEVLLQREISIIGVDFAGIRRGKEHTPMDRYCADKGVFIIENLCNLGIILNGRNSSEFTANIYPVNFIGMSGLPCRVTAEVD